MKVWAAIVIVSVSVGFFMEHVEAKNYQDWQARCHAKKVSYLVAMFPARGIHGDNLRTRRECEA